MKYRLSPAPQSYSQQQWRQRKLLAWLDAWLMLLLLAMCPLSVWIGGFVGGIDPVPQLGAGVMITGIIWLAASIRFRQHLGDQQKSFLLYGGIILVAWSILFFIPHKSRSPGGYDPDPRTRSK